MDGQEKNLKINVEIDMGDLVKLVSTTLRQLPYATNNAITRTAKEAVIAGQKELEAHLQVRKNFILKRVKILQYSKIGNLTAIIGIDSKVEGSPLILAFLETGGEKEPTSGAGIAVPLTGEAARPTFSQSVPSGLLYKNLAFDNNKGKKRTFIIPDVGVFQRIGPGFAGTIEIYSFKPSAKLPQRLQLREAMVAIIGQRFAAIFTEEFTKEILAKAARS